MQPYLVFGMPAADAQGQCEAERAGSAAEGGRSQDGRQRRRPTARTWHLVLSLGDSLLFIVLFLLLLPPPVSGIPAATSIVGQWEATIFWLCMAFASWSLAVGITQAQEVQCAESMIKSPLYALCSLVLTMLFCIMLLYLFLASSVVSYLPTLLLFLLVAAPGFVIWRMLLVEIIHLPHFRRQALIIGATAAGRSVSREVRSAKRSSIHVMGYIDEGMSAQEQQGDAPLLGDRGVLRALLDNGMVDMMIMALDYKTNPDLFQEALAGVQRGVALQPVTAVYESMSGKIPVEHIGDQWYTTLPIEQVVSPLYGCWRKVIDLVFGICGLVALGLLLPLLALLISLDSPGTIFYAQERVGRWGKPFRMYKLRSMQMGAEDDGGAVWASKNDARVTRVGRFLRATHLDELPQVLNILRGEMSLIGPRPEREAFVSRLEKTLPLYRCRLAVKPGLTGWAQVKYHYGGTANETLVKLQYDLYYIKHQSFMLDISIILMTVLEVLLRRGT